MQAGFIERSRFAVAGVRRQVEAEVAECDVDAVRAELQSAASDLREAENALLRAEELEGAHSLRG